MVMSADGSFDFWDLHGEYRENTQNNYEIIDRAQKIALSILESWSTLVSKNVLERLLKVLIFSTWVKDDEILKNMQAWFITELWADSLYLVWLQCWLEQEFGLQIDEKDWQPNPTIEQIASFIEWRMDHN